MVIAFFDTGHPEGFEEKDVYVCESRYNDTDKSKDIEAIKNWKSMLPKAQQAKAVYHPPLIGEPRKNVNKTVPSVFFGLNVAPEECVSLCPKQEPNNINSGSKRLQRRSSRASRTTHPKRWVRSRSKHRHRPSPLPISPSLTNAVVKLRQPRHRRRLLQRRPNCRLKPRFSMKLTSPVPSPTTDSPDGPLQRH